MSRTPLALLLLLGLVACDEAKHSVAEGQGPSPTLPPPTKSWIPTINIAPARGWAEGATPVPGQGLRVAAFAEDLEHPRQVVVLPNGDVLVAESNGPPRPEDGKGIRGWVQGMVQGWAGAKATSANRITLLRDADHDGRAETRTALVQDLRSPYGMALVGDTLYVANTDALLRFPYREGETRITAPGEKVTDLPGGPLNHHWTKNVIASPDGTKLYVAVGSNSNVGENGLEAERERAAVWEVDARTGQHRIFASGTRNPVGLAWEPGTKVLWVAVNERDELGSDLVPDYMTGLKDGAFYGWPFSYYGQHVDSRVPPNPGMVAKAIPPDYALGPHTASLGLAFAPQQSGLPAPYNDGAFIGQHGSWNRRPPSGYKVIFVPFRDGRPNGAPIDILTGFLDAQGQAQGRPVGVAPDGRGGLLVADDVGNKIWRVTAGGGIAQR
ncbi:PQQ-dependent sugar dehydrogenase [Paracraurococcus lichenis]|uniref:Sorbosone dehydrogenase family protein n=1 Tax=Paracraurococcus lichenis TaxID=3064888 RepID=A0ABT9E8E8_9PROT|nr:sorbosone dehydrogenase family protein [Paracraurococcus sp. LOR1-02]MDO9712426.1 sorbosone dehydrogenase family protein [Paracraurococcus sp. LOR1-02]